MRQLGCGDPRRNRRAEHPFERSDVVDRKENKPLPFLLQSDQDVALYLPQIEGRRGGRRGHQLEWCRSVSGYRGCRMVCHDRSFLFGLKRRHFPDERPTRPTFKARIARISKAPKQSRDLSGRARARQKSRFSEYVWVAER